MRKPFTKQLGCVALALVLLIAFLPSTVSATTPCTGLHKPDLTTLYPADWNDQTGGYGYDYYKCSICGAACDQDGNPHVHVGPGNGCSGGEKKHVPDLSNEEGADFTPCYGGFKVPHYHCIACGTVVDKDGTRLNPDPPTKQTHTPGTEEHPADYTPCNGGFQTNFYICVDCGNPVDINGAPMQWVAGNGSHTRGSELHDPDFLPCRGGIDVPFCFCTVCGCFLDANGNPIQPRDPTASHVPDGERHDPDFPCQPGFHQQYQICTVCECRLDVNGNPIQGEEPTESHVLTSESYPSNYTPCGGGFRQSYYICTNCGWDVDANGNPIVWEDGDGNHSLEEVQRLEPTSDSYGYIAHWRCTRCDMRLLDAAGNVPADEEQLLLSPLDPNQPEEQTQVKSSALQTVPATVAEQYSTVEAVQNALTEAASAPTDADATTVYLDVVLQAQDDDGEWVTIPPENFPAEGLDVTLPYPEGTGMNGYTFIVTHMITHGERAGEVETLTADPQQDGIHVHVTSLSPIAITYWASNSNSNPGSSNNGPYPDYTEPQELEDTPTATPDAPTSAMDERSPQTGDGEPVGILLWIMLLLSSAAILSLLMNKKRA